jgi:hypothetical protein
MTILSISIALVALAGFVALWLRLQTVKKTVEHLKWIHDSSEVSRTVELSGLSLPTFTLPDERSVIAEPAERLIILGHRDLTIDLGNQPDGNEHGVIMNVTIETPPGTTRVVTSLRGFFLMFGSVIRDSGGTIVALNAKDHHLGYEALSITVVGVGAGTATLSVGGVLRDKNGDDSWSGTLLATALFLGPQF